MCDSLLATDRASGNLCLLDRSTLGQEAAQQLDGRLSQLEGQHTAVDGRLGALEGAAGALEGTQSIRYNVDPTRGCRNRWNADVHAWTDACAGHVEPTACKLAHPACVWKDRSTLTITTNEGVAHAIGIEVQRPPA